MFIFRFYRSQNVSTRFLHVDEKNQFHASAHEWGSFYIHLVDNEEPCMESTSFPVKEGFVQYGSTVKLVCSVTNQSLPYLVSISLVNIYLRSTCYEKNSGLFQLSRC